ncbi:MAG: hypothetical protein NC396_05025 [Bacteroides sp.]|nr:hypothetical protein [Bacteroides sp.]MCM1085721.1 hypothetical protein [Bacteroides sp.]
MFLKACFRVKRYRWGLVALCAVLAASCQFRKGVPFDAVARVGNEYLTAVELNRMMPEGILPTDSADVAQKKVSAWVARQVLLEKARLNLDELEADIEEQISQYRESLLIFLYENKITQQLLDTVVSDKEIEDYYKANQSQFVLKSNIVRTRFVKVSKTAKESQHIKRELFAVPFEESNLHTLAELCRNSADNYYLDDERWIFFNDLLREVPIQTYNQESFLRNNRNIEVNTGDYWYYVTIVDFKVRDMISPISFEKDRIRAIILNQRKREVQRVMEEDLLEKALRSGQIEYYW